jgi:hypothetical protein
VSGFIIISSGVIGRNTKIGSIFFNSIIGFSNYSEGLDSYLSDFASLTYGTGCYCY